VLAEKTLELDFFKRALQKVEARRQQSGGLARRHLRPNPGTNVSIEIERRYCPKSNKAPDTGIPTALDRQLIPFEKV